MADLRIDKGRLIFRALALFVGGMAVIGGLFFLCAGSLDYWQAWVYLAVLVVMMTATIVWIFQNDPERLERRMRTQEPEKTQKWVITIAAILSTLLFVLPGLDRRFEWSRVPTWLALVGLALVIAGYGLYIRVIQVNRYASRVIEVAAEQRVIDSGPYALVRHPMYLGMSIFFIGTALGLASYWTLIPALLMAPVLAVRAFNEEKTLARELVGYVEYTRKVRWRIIPGLW